jgi:hypothetical protein
MAYENYGGYLPKEYLGVHGGSAPSAIMNALIQQSAGPKPTNPYDGFLQHALNVAYPGANFAVGGVKTGQSVAPVPPAYGGGAAYYKAGATPPPYVDPLQAGMKHFNDAGAVGPAQGGAQFPVGPMPQLPYGPPGGASLGADVLTQFLARNPNPIFPVGGGKTTQNVASHTPNVAGPGGAGGTGGGGGGGVAPPETHPGPPPPATEHPTPAAPSITGNSAGYIQALGPDFNWVMQRPELLTQFQQFAQAANFGQNPDDFKTWIWAMDLGPQKDANRRQLALAEIFSRYPGQEWLRGRGDLVWAWENDPAGKAKNSSDFTGWLKAKGYNAQTPSFANALTASDYSRQMGSGFEWLGARPDLVTSFQDWAKAANFATNPDDFKTWLWAMDLTPDKDNNRRQLALAEIYSRYPGQEWLRGRGDIIWAWENDPSGKKGGQEFGAWVRAKGYNAQTPSFAGVLNGQPTAGGGGPGAGGGGTGAGGTAPGPTTPTHVTPAAGTPMGELPGNSEALLNLQRALNAHFANQSQQALRAYRAAGSQYGLENTGAFGQGAQELLGNLAVQFGTQGAEALHQSYESELDRLLQRYGIDTGASTQRYGVDASSASAGAARALERELGLGRLAGDEQGRFMDYDLGQRQIGAGVYGNQLDMVLGLINAMIQAGPENTSPALLNALAGFMPGSYSFLEN